MKARGLRSASARPVVLQDHSAKLVQTRVSERAKQTLAELANQRGLSEAAYLRGIIYQHLGLTPNDKGTP